MKAIHFLGRRRGRALTEAPCSSFSTPTEFPAFAHAESDKWARVIRDYNIRVE